MSDSEEEVTEKQYKIVLVGDKKVGKTAIALRYATNVYSKNYSPTTGVDFYLKRTTVAGSRNCALKLWDISGQAMQGRMLDKYIFGADAVMLVYDVTSTSTFDSLEEWLERSRAALTSADRRPSYALVANKIDLEHLRVIKSDRHHKFAQDNGLLTYAVSAKTGEGVNLCLQKISADLLGIRLSKQEQEQQQTVVRAEIVTYRETDLPRQVQTNANSMVCSLM